MYDVMKGIKVVEVAEHTFVPVAGMVLADWGADVIKVERAQGGDASRYIKLPGTDSEVNPYFEVGNRGKRSIALDLTQAEGREQLHRLLDGADVFLTNMRTAARLKLGIEAGTLMARYPRLIYARGTAYGLRGELKDAGGFDYPSAWCRVGAAHLQTHSGEAPPWQPGSIGDLTGGVTLAGAIAAALFRRERTGCGAVVDNALLMVGTFLMSQPLLATGIGAPPMATRPQATPTLALANNYRTRDGRWLSLCVLFDSWWPDLVAHLESLYLLDDSRFADSEARHTHRDALTAELNTIFARRDLDDWCVRLRTLKGVWSPVRTPLEALNDPQSLVNGFIGTVDRSDGASYRAAVSPAQFDECHIGELRAGPRFAQHTDEILRELGVDEAELAALRARSAIR
ncbi:CaiB/BaiF CoA transferase family protein [Pseudomonas sp. NFX15]|uniref:CaiB/BaiF CoA transferase family protein n=1 Tax=Pseudomonas sp. NFX15 TaxID=2816958 RepID=UPI003B8BA7D8